MPLSRKVFQGPILKTITQILGVNFFSGSPVEAVEESLRGGLVVVPSAPVLVGIEKDPALRAGVLGADLAITDSGLMVLLWWLLKREKLERVSGLEYLKLLLERLRAKSEGQEAAPLSAAAAPVFIPRTSPSAAAQGALADRAGEFTSKVFWVMPTVAARDQNLAWLRSQGFVTTVDDCYVAPHYGAGELHDDALLVVLRKRKPAHIIIALGGGVQERLGFALREALAADVGRQMSDVGSAMDSGSYRPGIHCIGAAIGFLSGEQVRIPMWVDYLYLGWLWRSISAPTKFVPRYWKATRLVWLMIRYRERAPIAED